MMKAEFEKYPGWEIVGKGIEDLHTGDFESIEGMLVHMAMPRLETHRMLLNIPEARPPSMDLNIALYHKLSDHGDGAHAQYNALRRRLLKFCNILDREVRWASERVL